MPELPEVETVKNNLKDLVMGKTIINVDVFYEKIIKNLTKEEFIETLKGQKIVNIDRIGKHLIFVLEDYYLVSHLRMEGKYYLSTDENFNKHEHVVFYFSNSNLRYQDTRKFGTMYLYSKNTNIYQQKPLNNVGLEPFDEKMSVEYLKDSYKKTTRPIKTSLLDQSVIAGLGNIYVDEVLFLSKIAPTRSTITMTDDDYKKIIDSSIKVLNKAIKLGGTTIKSFTVNHDISGRFQNELLVHTKKKCPVCGDDIIKIRVGGRGTYYCSRCQK
ncbi:MAG: DNA-formamidopyrimidine glycosylase [Bacilli bacterium]